MSGVNQSTILQIKKQIRSQFMHLSYADLYQLRITLQAFSNSAISLDQLLIAKLPHFRVYPTNSVDLSFTTISVIMLDIATQVLELKALSEDLVLFEEF